MQLLLLETVDSPITRQHVDLNVAEASSSNRYVHECLSSQLQASTEQENWVGVLQQVDIPAGGNAAAFLPKAVDYANNKCWGTLSCAVIVDAANLKSNAKAVDTAIANLRYGAITINMPSIVAFAMGHGPWGAYPGATPQVDQHTACAALHDC